MAREPSPEMDDELFKEVYGKEYTGPLGSRTDDSSSKGNNNNISNKRPASNSDDGDGDFVDPNAVPTDFTSREAKVWEAKAKAIERNWKKRKEEEMICKICGESGHFTQGCPSTLGGNRKSADFFERVPARDKHVRALFTEMVISQIEKDIGCKIRMDEKFLFVSGKDRLILSKGVDAVHKIIQEGKAKTESPPTYRRTRSKSPHRSPFGSDYKRSEPQRSHSNPRSTPRFPSRNNSQERGVEDRVRQDQRSFSRESPQARAFSNVGARGRSAHSRSPPRSNTDDHAYGAYNHNYSTGLRKVDDWNVARHGADFHSERKFDLPGFSQTLEDLELDFKKEALELARSHDQEEDDENYKHREGMREIREDYMQKLTSLRAMHSKQWEEFLQLDVQRKQQASFNAYSQQVYSNYDHSSRYTQYVGSNLPTPTDARSRYPYSGENYSSSTSPHDPYGDFQNPRSDGFGRKYGRY